MFPIFSIRITIHHDARRGLKKTSQVNLNGENSKLLKISECLEMIKDFSSFFKRLSSRWPVWTTFRNFEKPRK